MSAGYVKLSTDKIKQLCGYKNLNLVELANAIAEHYPKMKEAESSNAQYFETYLRGKTKASPEMVEAVMEVLDAPREDVIVEKDYQALRDAQFGVETERIALRHADFEDGIPMGATHAMMRAGATAAPYFIPKILGGGIISPEAWMEAHRAYLEAVQAGETPDGVTPAEAAILANTLPDGEPPPEVLVDDDTSDISDDDWISNDTDIDADTGIHGTDDEQSLGDAWAAWEEAEDG